LRRYYEFANTRPPLDEFSPANILNMVSDFFIDQIEIDTELINELQNLEDVKITLSPQEFEKLERIEVGDIDLNNKCHICLEDFVLKDCLVKLNCKHMFHEMCIGEWLQNRNVRCPVCRSDSRTNA
jgi:hypothetical protein